jgi:hypothetical protein
MTISTESHPAEEHPERFSPEDMSGRLIESEHRGRYWWAAQLAEGRTVLDAGCGTGYGSRILAAAGAKRVVGIDVDAGVIAENRRRAPPELEFQQGDVGSLELPDDSFDLVVCLEVIEHIDGREGALREMRRVLRDDGVLVISSPNRDVYPPGNAHHRYEYRPGELRDALLEHFGDVVLHRQLPFLASALLSDDQLAIVDTPLPAMSAVKTMALAPGDEPFTIAVAHAGAAPAMRSLAVMGDAFEVRWFGDKIRAAQDKRDEALRDRLRMSRERDAAVQTGLRSAEQLLEVENRLADLHGRLSSVENESELRYEQIVELDARLRAALAHSDALTERIERADAVRQAMTRSLSWRVTSPLRVFKRLSRG